MWFTIRFTSHCVRYLKLIPLGSTIRSMEWSFVCKQIFKQRNGTITVITVKGDPSYGYDIVFGTSLRKVNGEIRPVDYGNYVAKNRRKKTLTFPKLKPGTYYIAAHAFNAGENNQKVFSPWSNIRKIVIK